jgi:hypothetical protein
MNPILRLIAHIEAMKDDAHFCEHPEWEIIVDEALEAGEYASTFEISSNEERSM